MKSTGSKNSFGAVSTISVNGRSFTIFSLAKLEKQGWSSLERLPFSLKILLENVLRHEDGRAATAEDVEKFKDYSRLPAAAVAEIPFKPARVLLQDFTGVPAVVDLAAMRDAMQRLGGDPGRINPLIPANLVIDHSIQVDEFGSPDALRINEKLEYERNRERYGLLRWAQKSFSNFTVVPPGRGICHQVNLEYLASVVTSLTVGNDSLAFPDTLVGTDSHTTMVNGLGVLGWGVGGIEAEAVILGQAYYMPIPEVVGVKLVGAPRAGVTATDLVLRITEILRAKKVVGKFVEFYGPGLRSLSLPDRATVSNMAPEYGATASIFPVDSRTLDYLRLTGRNESLIRLVETYTKEQGLFWSPDLPEPIFSESLTLDLADLEANLAGPKRPQDRIPLRRAQRAFREALQKPEAQFGFGLSDEALSARVSVTESGREFELSHGSVVIAAITSCTNTSNPHVMIGAGLLARNALQRGVLSKPWVKTSLSPGSMAVTGYLEEAGLLEPLEKQGFYLTGYGCMTCIGNSGPLPAPIAEAIEKESLVAVAVLSGNRNFEGRIHGSVRANYLAAPPLVVAYALAGRADIDFETEPLGIDSEGRPVFLHEIWPSDEEIKELVSRCVRKEFFDDRYRAIYEGEQEWQSMPVPEGLIYRWDPASTYIRRPPFLEDITLEVPPVQDIEGARVLIFLSDSVTTDHISPAGAIPAQTPAGRYLLAAQVQPSDFNSYGSRRGNHEVMIRGTFANIRLRNKMLKGVNGGFTLHLPHGEQMTIYEAAERYRREGVPLIVLAGKEYGTGSSRDWAAKGTALLGVKAVIAEGYERIHRSNLLGMGVLPLQFPEGTSAGSLGLTGQECFSFKGLNDLIGNSSTLQVEAAGPDGKVKTFEVIIRLDTPVEIEIYRQGGILPKVLRELLAG